ncbi:hypothetical protein A7J71_31140 [Achromobacter insolitus]|uniref:hypothetical protein n=1 Tax=Achromobacter insolitus TaxID=217204 RepID=UPI0007C30C8B|nr:hypothetical protein [Achromobacter insolitus]APX78475.1 hypothetical protein BUW96_29060 [Achromobacter insolitus]OAD17916.1 hypothetical protein A3839_03560 [Achromobacter insolitus]OAE61449.1 hypothetical protein A7J71_31140 [Achromobacter insolitus]OCZ59426.1 hypothetical protein A7P22_25100 [Achromobacter insolitus]OWT62969.1 hypothetical protein CEY08_08995 [Achromobacter insolitus]
MKLIEFLQKHATTITAGGEASTEPRTGTDQAAREDLRLVQATNNGLFKVYFALLIVIVVVTIGIALAFHQEMGGLAVVLSTGGVIQGGLVLKLCNVWMDKARIDIVATLASTLTPDKLQPVLMELSQQIRR